MNQVKRRCLKCDRPVRDGGWLCPACRLENRQYAPEAEGVSNLCVEEEA